VTAFRLIVAILVGILVVIMLFIAAQYVGSEFKMMLAWSSGLIPYVLLSVPAPAFAGYLAGRAIWRWRRLDGQADSGERSPLPSVVVWTLLVGYVLTWMFGAPAVQSRQNTWAVQTYKEIRDRTPHKNSDLLPQVRTVASFPMIPGVLMTYHEYQVANLYGWGGWEVDLWYVAGVKSIFRLPVWFS